MQRGLTTWGSTHRALFNAVLSLLWNLCLQLFTACASGSILKKNTTVITYVCDSHWKRNLRERAQVLHTVVFTLGTLSKDDFERCTSTGSEAFSSFICLDAKKFVFLSFFSLIKTILPGILNPSTAQCCKKPTSGWRPSLKNAVA